MAEFRQVYTKLWVEDEWFCELPVDAKLLFIYLFTNSHASVAGIYQLPTKAIAFESGLSIERATLLLAEFQAAGKIMREGAVIWVKNMRRYQDNGAPTVQTRIKKDVDDIPDSSIKRSYWAAYYPDIPYRYPIDRVLSDSATQPSDTDTDTDTDTETETETETDTETKTECIAADAAPAPAAAEKPKRGSPRTPKEPPPPAVVAFHAGTNRYPNKALWAGLDETIGRDPGDVARFERVCRGYVACGWNPGNVKGMVRFYLDNRMPGDDTARAPGGNGNGQGEPKSWAAIREADRLHKMKQEGAQDGNF